MSVFSGVDREERKSQRSRARDRARVNKEASESQQSAIDEILKVPIQVKNFDFHSSEYFEPHLLGNRSGL